MSGFVASSLWLLLFIGGGIFLAYQRTDLRTSTIAAGIRAFVPGVRRWALVVESRFPCRVRPDGHSEPDRVPPRENHPSGARAYRRMLPSMSDTEREALEAGNVWWDGELFSGMPEWDRADVVPGADSCRTRNRRFIDGPCEELCGDDRRLANLSRTRGHA